jgi:putative copper resistance protein D
LNDPLISIRAIHFVATLSVAGVVFFVALIAEPALRRSVAEAQIVSALRARLAWIAWASLVIALLSAVPWLILVAQAMSGQPLGAL